MLVLFRAGPRGDRTLDVIDVIPRASEARVRATGLGLKEGAYFWVEVDTKGISDNAFDALATELLEPDISETAVVKHPLKNPVETRKIRAKHKNRLDQKRLEKIDPTFKASTVTRTKDAKRIFPEKILTIRQLRTSVKNKRTGRYLYGG